MSRWTNTRPMFRITYVFESEAMDAFVRDYRDATERAQRAEARVRELEEAQGELLGLADFWEQTWRRSAQASWAFGERQAAYSCQTCRDTGQVSSTWGTVGVGGGSIGACPDCAAWRKTLGGVR